MHNLALTLQKKGHTVTGSDDVIYEPSRTRLAQAGLLPGQEGWFPEKITPEIDAVILGMHARIDNPELIRARNWDCRCIPIRSSSFTNRKGRNASWSPDRTARRPPQP